MPVTYYVIERWSPFGRWEKYLSWDDEGSARDGLRRLRATFPDYRPRLVKVEREILDEQEGPSDE